MLHVKLLSFYKQLVPWLLTHFNPHERVLQAEVGKEYVIRTDGVCDIFGLPEGEEKVVLIKKIKSLLNVFENDPLTTPMLAEFIVNLKDGAKTVADVDGIIKLNWCYYVLDALCSSIVKWHENKQKSGENPKRVKGCMLLLEISYFHRFVFKGELVPTQLPSILTLD
ncbi:Ribonuclease H [Bienertia sinuspersici]